MLLANFSTALLIIIFESIIVLLIPPMLNLSFARILLALLRYSTQHSSCGRFFSIGINMSATDLEETIVPLWIGFSLCILADNSKRAISLAALASPIPSILHSSSNEYCDNLFRELSQYERILRDKSTALKFFVPELIRMASNSASLSELVPELIIFSLGLSSLFQSLIFTIL